ncbi:uncharacterized protein C11orf98 homolog [Gigantopelta aegis]|uniref:uncharacterized protein C11orf98 homolog n=1 Tax=Gigantopelta aegis TaxID=1735272 RepID=UPI001B88A929|nr:uncharacterized protein C11orf98 homolog [Gigantopelta aegis]
MGLFSLMSNKKKTPKEKKKFRHRRQKKAELKKRRGPQVIEIKDMELLSKEQIKKKMKNTHVNITVSGKRRRKMLKRLRNQERANILAEAAVSKTNDKPSTSSTTAVSEEEDMTE